jgi:hypothetical protein
MRTMNSTVLNKSSSFLKDLCDAQVFFFARLAEYIVHCRNREQCRLGILGILRKLWTAYGFERAMFF